MRNIIYELPHEFPNDLRLKTLGDKEILVKYQNCMGKPPSFQPLLHKQIFGNGTQKVNKSRC